MKMTLAKGKHSKTTASPLPALVMFVLFAVLTACVVTIDKQPIAADASMVGLGSLNLAFHNLTGVNWTVYGVSQLGGYLSIASMVVFFAIGLAELVRARSFKGVDKAIYLIAGAYVVMLVLYVGFDKIALNYRPVLVDGQLEPSFPSSHTFLAIGALGCAVVWINARLDKGMLKSALAIICVLLALVTVAARLLSGVHWATDILASVFLGLALVFFYRYLVAKV